MLQEDNSLHNSDNAISQNRQNHIQNLAVDSVQHSVNMQHSESSSVVMAFYEGFLHISGPNTNIFELCSERMYIDRNQDDCIVHDFDAYCPNINEGDLHSGQFELMDEVSEAFAKQHGQSSSSRFHARFRWWPLLKQVN